MTEIRIENDYPHPPAKVWRALTDPELVPLWTATGQGARPEGFAAEVGTRFKFVGKAVPGWNGIVYCEVLEAREPTLLRYSWATEENGPTTEVAYRLEPQGTGTRFTYEHTGFAGIGGFLMANVIIGPVRRKMLSKGLPPVLDAMDDDGPFRLKATVKRDLGLAGL